MSTYTKKHMVINDLKSFGLSMRPNSTTDQVITKFFFTIYFSRGFQELNIYHNLSHKVDHLSNIFSPLLATLHEEDICLLSYSQGEKEVFLTLPL